MRLFIGRYEEAGGYAPTSWEKLGDMLRARIGGGGDGEGGEGGWGGGSGI